MYSFSFRDKITNFQDLFYILQYRKYKVNKDLTGNQQALEIDSKSFS